MLPRGCAILALRRADAVPRHLTLARVWLISDGLPLNEFSRVMGHEQISMMLDRYTHAFDQPTEAITSVLADVPLTLEENKGE